MSEYKYHVFLSFRGEDTRNEFTDHLYTAMVQAGIQTFRDDDEIERGNLIATQLQKAIQDAKIAVIVLSRNYASSTWCLEELSMIMERRTSVGLVVLPVFYKVDPSDVRKQTGSFGKVFARHKKFLMSKEEKNKVERWRYALKEVAQLAGMTMNEISERSLWPESLFIQDIVKEVKKMLPRPRLNVASKLFGIDLRAKDINLWLCDESSKASTGVIYGIGGIGKTTIAKTVYNLNFERFEGSSFLPNVRDTLNEPGGLARLQKQLLSDILKGKLNDLYSIDEGTIKIKNAISCRNVLIVLDDVDEMDKLDAIIGRCEWLKPGSKVIITTRHARLLKPHEVCEKFAAKELDNSESQQLFCWHAFNQIDPIEEFGECSRKVVSLCGGLPLALEVLGSFLSGCSRDVWENALHKLQAIPHNRIHDVLKLSYETLDEHDQRLFLDIACFFVGTKKDYTVRILDGCGFYTQIGIQNLSDRCLLTVERNRFMMHQLIRDMGREIIRQESTDEPGERSRIWHNKEAFTVLEEQTGTKNIRGLTVDLLKLMEDQGESMARLETNTFENMKHLKLLKLNYMKFNGDYSDLPKRLIWLCWRGFPLKIIPTNFFMKKIVSIDLRHSSLKHVWHEIKSLAELKYLNLSHSHSLVSTPDFTGLTKLEKLILKDCSKLARIDESVGKLVRLESLNLKDCKSLRKLPGTIGLLSSLVELNISGCSKLDELPKDLERIQSLQGLFADGIAIGQSLFTGRRERYTSSLAGNLWHSTFLSWLSPMQAPWSTNLSMTLPSCLGLLSLKNCSLSDDSVLNILNSLPSLEIVNLSDNPFQNLPWSIGNLSKLKILSLANCTELQSLPELPANLQTLDISKCSSLERIKSPSKLPDLVTLGFLDCDNLVEVEGVFALESINKVDSKILQSLGLFDTLPFGSMEVTMHNFISKANLKMPIQALHECGIINTFIPGSEIPSCYIFLSRESLISWDVPPRSDHKIAAMNICVSYALNLHAAFLFLMPNYIKISNKTKRMRWTYSPMCLAIPENIGEEMLWLSRWRLGEQLEAGDQLDISVIMGPALQVKMWGIYFEYEPVDDKVIVPSDQEIVTRTPQWFQTCILTETAPDECFHCHHTIASLQFTLLRLDEWVPENLLYGKIINLKQVCLLCKAIEDTEKKHFLRDPLNHYEELMEDYYRIQEKMQRRMIQQSTQKSQRERLEN